MSTQSDQSKAASESAGFQANIGRSLTGIYGPEYNMLLGNPTMGTPGLIPSALSSAQGGNGMMAMDRQNLAGATSQLNSGYQQAGFGLGQNIGYGGLRSGEGRRSPFAMNAALGGAATTLGQQYASALNNLNFMSAQASMTDYNKMLGLMGMGVGSEMGLAGGFSQNMNQAIAGLKSTSEADDVIGLISSIVGIAGKVIA
jgi:hypothetical protein